MEIPTHVAIYKHHMLWIQSILLFCTWSNINVPPLFDPSFVHYDSRSAAFMIGR